MGHGVVSGAGGCSENGFSGFHSKQEEAYPKLIHPGIASA
jgi:hypothetical protein